MISKNGIIAVPNFYEGDAMYMTKYSGGYTPGTGVNSCMSGAQALFDYSTGITKNTIFRVIAKVSWSGFDKSNPDGSFSMWWQGAQYNYITGIWEWQGRNYICTALNDQQNVTTLVLSKESGTYTYNITFYLPDSYRETWSASAVGFRSDYSNGVGRINIDSMIIVEDKYYAGDGQDIKAHANNNYISTNNIIEI